MLNPIVTWLLFFDVALGHKQYVYHIRGRTCQSRPHPTRRSPNMPPGHKPVLLTSTLLEAALRIATDPVGPGCETDQRTDDPWRPGKKEGGTWLKLVVGLNPSEKIFLSVNWDDEIPNINGKIKKWQPNHQPDVIKHSPSRHPGF